MMTTGCPQIRSDLVFSPQKGDKETTVVVKDPVTGRFFRLREVEYFICQQLDGATSLEVIRNRTEEKFSAPLAASTLEQFIETLRRGGLLQNGNAEPTHHRIDEQRRIRGSLLYLRFKAFDPDHLLDRLLPKLPFLFTPSFLIVSGALVLFALSLTVLNWEQIERDLWGLYRFDTLFWISLTLFLTITAHEFAHGLTCKYFGGEVHEMGFLLMYFQPAFYTNVSDSWLFPEKSKRLWVTFAGAYFDLVLWGAATLLWRITDPDTWPHFAALFVMATSGVRSLFNLNPLIKLDGYYLLSDYLEIPNLRQKCFRYIGARVARLLGRDSDVKEVTPKERRIYLIYGLLGLAYTWCILGFIVFSVGGFLIGRYEVLGLLLFAAFLLMLFGQPLTRLLPSLSRFWGGDEGLPKSSEKYLRLTAAAIVLLLIVWTELKITGDFRILPSHNADVRTEVEGVVERVHVREGQLVHQGDQIATLLNRDLRAELQKVIAEIAEKEAKLKMLRVGPREEEISVAKAQVASAVARVTYPQRVLGMNETAYARKLISLKEVEQSRGEVGVRKNELQEAERKLHVLLAGSRPEEIAAAEFEINRLETQQHYIEERIRLLSVLSPINGILTTPAWQLKQMVGMYVQRGELIADVHELKTITAEILIPEREIGDVQVGQVVALKTRAYPTQTFYGKVVSIGTRADGGANNPNEKVDPNLPPVKGRVVVTTQLDNTSLLLKPEMTGKAKIFGGKRSLLHLILRRLGRTFGVEIWSLF
jgi:putative peptide zinc metalloprotease protein